MSDAYVHGYSTAEQIRLTRQAGILAPFIHAHAIFAPGSRVLEAGCGVGAQTVELATRNPQVSFVAVDRSADSIELARQRVAACALGNVELRVADINELPCADAEFDGVFLCFVLEHLRPHERALGELRRVMQPGARLHAFEGDHGSVLPCPDDAAIHRLVAAVSRSQSLQGADPYIGRRLGPLLIESGFQDVRVEPCVAYADATRPAWVDEFTQATFIDMMKGQRAAVVGCGLLNELEWRHGIEALERTKRSDGSFSYTFFRATASR